eukprot:TRINITY_DN4055_c0_g3_i1.p1 TRINITY_DN4055_c0_g3~~TRINITY_DN4055_c0_g3_i1.p1  ORF type:complete len:682 (+),score=109.62 TRINITY_DN4055_c0_g3_i1:78-2048(+)
MYAPQPVVAAPAQSGGATLDDIFGLTPTAAAVNPTPAPVSHPTPANMGSTPGAYTMPTATTGFSTTSTTPTAPGYSIPNGYSMPPSTVTNPTVPASMGVPSPAGTGGMATTGVFASTTPLVGLPAPTAGGAGTPGFNMHASAGIAPAPTNYSTPTTAGYPTAGATGLSMPASATPATTTATNYSMPASTTPAPVTAATNYSMPASTTPATATATNYSMPASTTPLSHGAGLAPDVHNSTGTMPLATPGINTTATPSGLSMGIAGMPGATATGGSGLTSGLGVPSVGAGSTGLGMGTALGTYNGDHSGAGVGMGAAGVSMGTGGYGALKDNAQQSEIAQLKQEMMRVKDELQKSRQGGYSEPPKPTQPAMHNPNVWACRTCTLENALSSSSCSACETPRPADVQPVAAPATGPRTGFDTWVCQKCSHAGNTGYACQLCSNPKNRPPSPRYAPPAPAPQPARQEEPAVGPNEWQCEACTFVSKKSSSVCEMCGMGKPAKVVEREALLAVPDGWECGQCTLANEESSSRCSACGSSAPSHILQQTQQRQGGYPGASAGTSAPVSNGSFGRGLLPSVLGGSGGAANAGYGSGGIQWQEDSSALTCNNCSAAFSLILRKHHCRACGFVFCYKCSSHTISLRNSKQPERVCDACFSDKVSPE